MKVYLYAHAPMGLAVLELDEQSKASFPNWLISEVPEDVLDRHDKALAEYQAVQRILRVYKNES